MYNLMRQEHHSAYYQLYAELYNRLKSYMGQERPLPLEELTLVEYVMCSATLHDDKETQDWLLLAYPNDLKNLKSAATKFDTFIEEAVEILELADTAYEFWQAAVAAQQRFPNNVAEIPMKVVAELPPEEVRLLYPINDTMCIALFRRQRFLKERSWEK